MSPLTNVFFNFITILFYEKNSHIQPTTGTYKDWSRHSPPYILSIKKVRATKNFIKDKMTGRVDILWRIFEKMRKIKNLSHAQYPKKHRFFYCFRRNWQNPETTIIFIAFLSKMRHSISTLPVSRLINKGDFFL